MKLSALQEERAKEIARMGVNPFEFLKYVKIQEPGDLAVDYILWPHLKDFFWCLLNYKLIDLIKAKQIGVSWALGVYALWKIYFTKGQNVLEFSKGEKESQQLLDKSRVIYNNLPAWMKFYTKDPDNMKEFGFKEIKSRITAYPSTSTAGIGETAGLVVHDESDFHEFYEVNLSHTRATVADKPDRQLVSVSTVDKTRPDSYFKNHWRDAESGKNGFKALFYGVFVRPDRDEVFYEQLVKENEETPWVVEGNYPRTVEEALSPLAATSCFDSDVLKDMWDNASAPVETRQGFIHVFCPPQIGTIYIAGVDVGEGVGLDYSTLVIVGKRGLMSEVAAVIYTNTIGTDSFAFEVDRLCSEYFNPSLIVDNIGVGRAVIDKLVELGYPNLYKMNDKKYGFAATKPNKRELLVKLVEKVNNKSLITRYKPMIKELMEYQWIKGYPEPTGKTHGDLVSALMHIIVMFDKISISPKAKLFVGGKQVW